MKLSFSTVGRLHNKAGTATAHLLVTSSPERPQRPGEATYPVDIAGAAATVGGQEV